MWEHKTEVILGIGAGGFPRGVRHMAAITERLRQAVSLARQLPREEQDAVAALMLTEMGSDTRWTRLLDDPRFGALLERMATEALAEDDARLTRALDELL